MTKTTYFAAVALLAIAAPTLRAQETSRIPVAADSKLWIDGTSNLHEWSCKATTIDAAIDVDKAQLPQFAASAPKGLEKVDVKIPVKALHCNHGGMDGNVYKALKADGSPSISYIMGTFKATGETKDGFTLHTVGKLEIAGKTNEVSMDVTAVRMPDGSVKATGMVPIKMTDYGIQPPTAIFGRLKTGDEVKVNFELTIGGRAIAEAIGNR